MGDRIPATCRSMQSAGEGTFVLFVKPGALVGVSGPVGRRKKKGWISRQVSFPTSTCQVALELANCQLLPTLGVVHAWQPAPPVSADGEASLPEQPTLPSLPSGIEKRLETVQPKVSKTCFGVYLCLVGMTTGIEALTFSVVSK